MFANRRQAWPQQAVMGASALRDLQTFNYNIFNTFFQTTNLFDSI